MTLPSLPPALVRLFRAVLPFLIRQIPLIMVEV